MRARPYPDMIFRDVTLCNGAIYSQREFDTDRLVPGAVDLAGATLKRSRLSIEPALHGDPRLPPFGVKWGMDRIVPGLFLQAELLAYGVYVADDLILGSMVLPANPAPREESVFWEIAALSQVGPIDGADFTRLYAQLAALRPVAIDAPTLASIAHPEEAMIAADFATCAAAALLLNLLESR